METIKFFEKPDTLLNSICETTEKELDFVVCY